MKLFCKATMGAAVASALLLGAMPLTATPIYLTWDDDFATPIPPLGNDHPGNLLLEVDPDGTTPHGSSDLSSFYNFSWTLAPNGDVTQVVIDWTGNGIFDGMNDGTTIDPSVPYIADAGIWIKQGREHYEYIPGPGDPVWDGQMTVIIDVSATGHGMDSISHIDLTGTPVPDGGATVALLGLALLGLGGARRVAASRSA